MSFWAVVFIFLMLFWLLGGGYFASRGDQFNVAMFGGNTLLPWICVAILGAMQLGGLK